MSEYIEHDAASPGVGVVEKRAFTFGSPAEPMQLESGASLGPVTLAYETYGQLNAARDNAVLVCHALTGDAHAAGVYSADDAKPGWWDIIIGPGKPIDTDRFFVVCSNILGGCAGSTGPSSLNPETGKPYGLDFPLVTVGDMVRAQKRLMDHMSVDRLLAVVGGSLGGMQVLEWAVRFPEKMAAALPLATTPRHSALNIAFHEVARQAIMSDPNWLDGQFYGTAKPATGLAVARMIGHVTYLSDEAMRRKFGRRLQDKDAFSYNLDVDFQVESYLRYQGRSFVDRFDANSFLYITKAADYFDLAQQHGQGSLAQALSKARARFLAVSFSSDWLYPTAHSRELVKAMKKNGLQVSFCEVEADMGHDAFLLRSLRLFELVEKFLANTHRDVRRGKA